MICGVERRVVLQLDHRRPPQFLCRHSFASIPLIRQMPEYLITFRARAWASRPSRQIDGLAAAARCHNTPVKPASQA